MIRIAQFLMVIGFCAFVGCDSAHHLTKMNKHKDKAIEKGAIFENDTLWKYITKTDTIRDSITNELIIRDYIVDSIPFGVERLVYVPMSRQERLAYKDSLKYADRVHRREIKVYKDSLRFVKQMHKSDNKTEVKKLISFFMILKI